jgi:hypothetical protein
LLTTSGYLDEGRVLLGEVLGAIGSRCRARGRRAIAAALLARAQLALRGLSLRAPARPRGPRRTTTWPRSGRWCKGRSQ